MDTFTLNVTTEHLNVLFTGLGELPHKHAGPVASALAAQLEGQFAARRAEANPTKRRRRAAPAAPEGTPDAPAAAAGT